MTARILTQAYLKELFDYNLDTGVFTRKIYRSSRAKKGDIAGHVFQNSSGKSYMRINIDRKLYQVHRLAWLYVCGEFPPDEIDHEDGNGLNNKWSNLRAVDGFENHKNMRLSSRNKSGCVGVSWRELYKNWRARIMVDRKEIHLGSFPDKTDAIIARKMAEYKYGFHPNHGTQRAL